MRSRRGLTPGAGGHLGLGLGYSRGAWRAGGALTTAYEDGVVKPERVTTASVSLSYVRDARFALTLTYADQTWFGSPTNTSLTRGVMLWAQRRWLR